MPSRTIGTGFPDQCQPPGGGNWSTRARSSRARHVDSRLPLSVRSTSGPIWRASASPRRARSASTWSGSVPWGLSVSSSGRSKPIAAASMSRRSVMVSAHVAGDPACASTGISAAQSCSTRPTRLAWKIATPAAAPSTSRRGFMACPPHEHRKPPSVQRRRRRPVTGRDQADVTADQRNAVRDTGPTTRDREMTIAKQDL